MYKINEIFEIVYGGENKTLKRVSKTKIKGMFDKYLKVKVYMSSSKLDIHSPFGNLMDIEIDSYKRFCDNSNYFSNYNCNNKTGNTVCYYIEV